MEHFPDVFQIVESPVHMGHYKLVYCIDKVFFTQDACLQVNYQKLLSMNKTASLNESRSYTNKSFLGMFPDFKEYLLIFYTRRNASVIKIVSEDKGLLIIR